MGTLAFVVVLLGALSTGKSIESEIIATTVGSSVMMPCGSTIDRRRGSSTGALPHQTHRWDTPAGSDLPPKLRRTVRRGEKEGREGGGDSGTFFCTLSLNTSNTEHSKDYIIRVYEDLAALMESEDVRSEWRNSTAETNATVVESRRIAGQSYAIHFLCTAAVTGALLLAFAVHCFLHRFYSNRAKRKEISQTWEQCSAMSQVPLVPVLLPFQKHEEDKEEEEEHFDDYSNLHMAHRDAIYENINKT
ncbi:unnamed protein product [Lampetra planeri]